MFKVYRKGTHPKPKKHFYPNEFATRQGARNFCRNRSWEEGLVIVHPCGKEEKYARV
jgi:hypothetical protein